MTERRVGFYRCRACWTLKVMNVERHPASNDLRFIPCPACDQMNGYAEVRFIIPDTFPVEREYWVAEN